MAFQFRFYSRFLEMLYVVKIESYRGLCVCVPLWRPVEDRMLYSKIMPKTCINKAVATMAPLPKTGFLINLNKPHTHNTKINRLGQETK